jgi:hypothetical protein
MVFRERIIFACVLSERFPNIEAMDEELHETLMSELRAGS